MKLTLKNIRQLKKDSESPLMKRVCNYVIDEWSNYDDKVCIFKDVLYYGCQSGTVGFLIWYTQTTAFYQQHRSEINDLLYNVMSETGLYSLPELFGKRWDTEDPLATDDFNQNLLAWFGFEETLRHLAQNFECLEEII